MMPKTSSCESLRLARWNACGGPQSIIDTIHCPLLRLMSLQYRMVEGLVDHGNLLKRFNSASTSSDHDTLGESNCLCGMGGTISLNVHLYENILIVTFRHSNIKFRNRGEVDAFEGCGAFPPFASPDSAVSTTTSASLERRAEGPLKQHNHGDLISTPKEEKLESTVSRL